VGNTTLIALRGSQIIQEAEDKSLVVLESDKVLFNNIYK
jgi:hypothetical protein